MHLAEGDVEPAAPPAGVGLGEAVHGRGKLARVE